MKKFNVLQRLLPTPKLSVPKGFTLIEVLVAAFIGGLIVSSLLAFLTSILTVNRNEEAKSESQGEIQAALDFIADDLQEAIYIYDADGLDNPSTATPPGIRDQLPRITNPSYQPVLAFWKRKIYERDDDVRPIGFASDVKVSTLPNTAGQYGSSRFVYSFVAYYLVSEFSGEYSDSMQIMRWELNDGIRSECQNTDPTTCNTVPGLANAVIPTRLDTDAVAGPDTNFYTAPDPGFRIFDRGGVGSLKERMNRWNPIETSYNFANSQFLVLADFVDDTLYTAAQDDGVLGNSPIEIPIRPNSVFVPTTRNGDCADPSIGVGGEPTDTIQRVPSTFTVSAADGNANNRSSFFACVNSTKVVARVWLRGNSLVRLTANEARRNPITSLSDTRKNFLPTSDVRAFGRGQLVIE